MSITTKRGDGGQIGLSVESVSRRADLRVESYGSIDELNTGLGFARSICQKQRDRSLD
jgi:cob(I)alamin adenosyltransferase